MLYPFDPMFFIFLAPAMLLAFWAQYRVSATYAEAQRVPAPMSGAAAARRILDSAGLRDVEIEPVPGHLSDHYDPSHRVLRLSPAVYQGRTMAAVGIAAHEAGHALQHAHSYAPLAIRNAAVPLASFGTNFSFLLLILGVMLQFGVLIYAGIALFGGVVFFQLVNLPVEFNASARAKDELVMQGIVGSHDMAYVNRVLSAAAWTYVAATLHSVLTLLYYIMRFAGGSRDE